MNRNRLRCVSHVSSWMRRSSGLNWKMTDSCQWCSLRIKSTNLWCLRSELSFSDVSPVEVNLMFMFHTCSALCQYLNYRFLILKREAAFTVIHTFIRWWWWLPCTVSTSSSGAVWGSVSCPRTLWHTDQGNQTNDLPIPRQWLFPWATAETDHHTSCSPVLFCQPIKNLENVTDFLSASSISAAVINRNVK